MKNSKVKNKPIIRHSSPSGVKLIKGYGSESGIAIGHAIVIRRGEINVSYFPIPSRDISKECKRFESSVKAVQKQLAQLITQSKKFTEKHGQENNIDLILETQLHMLRDSRLVKSVLAHIKDKKINAEYAIQQEIKKLEMHFKSIDDAYLSARIDDIWAVGNRLVRHLLAPHGGYNLFSSIQPHRILISDEITPADTISLTPHSLAGFASENGNSESHTNIMARALGIPALIGAPNLTKYIKTNDLIILDSLNGRIHLRPSSTLINEYKAIQSGWLERRKYYYQKGNIRSETKDGIQIHLSANLELPQEINNFFHSGAENIGLFRTEFFYMKRNQLPSEVEQFRMLRSMIQKLDGKELTIRTLDAGGEKNIEPLEDIIPTERQHALGLRAIRIGLHHPALLENQIAAILRAYTFGPVRILLPMITTIEEVRRTRALIVRTARKLKRKGVQIPDNLPPIGVMIETAGAAFIIKELAQECDFIAIGSNDLLQYAIAVDRSEASISDLYDPFHPGFLRLLKYIIQEANQADIPAHLCGEIAHYEELLPLLIGMGLRHFSMTPCFIPRTKNLLRAIDTKEAKRLATKILDLGDRKKIKQQLNKVLSKIKL